MNSNHWASTKNAAFITGGAKRIGREIAINLARKGYDIAISYNKSAEEIESLAKEIAFYDVDFAAFEADLFDNHQVKNLAKRVLEKFPHCNLLVNNASIFNKSSFIESDEEEIFQNFNIHFFAPAILSLEFAKHFKNSLKIFPAKSAQIINMIDKAITRYDTSYFYYLLSKKSLADLTKMLALQLAPEIRVNGIAPGFILNSVDEKNPQAETQRLIEKIPLKKQGSIKNILQAVEALLDNDFINGQILFIDGGASLNHAG